MRPNHKHDLSSSIIIDSDNVSLIANLRLGPQIMFFRFDKKSFFNTVLGFTPCWDYRVSVMITIVKNKVEHNEQKSFKM